MQKNIIQGIGWYGVIVILLAYGLSMFQLLSTESIWYLVLNLSGALGIAVEAASKRDRQPMVLNGIWAGLALFSLIRIWIG